MIKVLVVDDSAVVRQILTTELSKTDDMEVIATAMDPYIARDKILKLNPDVITLDLDMPRMDGMTFLRKLMKHRPMPVVVVSSHTQQGGDLALKALELGAVDVVSKPGAEYTVVEISQMLIDRIRAAAAAKHLQRRPDISRSPEPVHKPVPKTAAGKVIAIGASTGGTEAIRKVLSALPANTPGTLIVQHMPAHFTSAFASRLNDICALKVLEARDGDRIVQGVALVAPGNYHMTVARDSGGYRVEVKDGPRVYHQRPSVDVLLHSMADQVGPDAVGVILTGMGADGSAGMKHMYDAGGHTLAQDEQSCVVAGMPKEAVRTGGVDKVVPLDRMGKEIIRAVSREPAGV